MGAFLPPRLYADIAMHTPDARRILTFDGEVNLTGQTNVAMREELKHILDDSLVSAEMQAAQTERLAEQTGRSPLATGTRQRRRSRQRPQLIKATRRRSGTNGTAPASRAAGTPRQSGTHGIAPAATE